MLHRLCLDRKGSQGSNGLIVIRIRVDQDGLIIIVGKYTSSKQHKFFDAPGAVHMVCIFTSALFVT